MRQISFIILGIVILGIASAKKAASVSANDADFASIDVLNSGLEIDYECEFTNEEFNCEVEGEIDFDRGPTNMAERGRIDASFDLECISKKDSFRIRDRHADVDREGDDLEITGREDGERATVSLEDFFDQHSVLRRKDLDAKLKVNGSTLHGSCEVDIDRHGTGTNTTTSTGTYTVTETVTETTTQVLAR